jgi:hypothetical protein
MGFFQKENKIVKFIYSEKATKFCEISDVNLSYVVPVKSTVEISQNLWPSQNTYMNFTYRNLFENSEKTIGGATAKITTTTKKT